MPCDQATSLQMMQHAIDRSPVPENGLLRLIRDTTNDFVPIHGLSIQCIQNHEIVRPRNQILGKSIESHGASRCFAVRAVWRQELVPNPVHCCSPIPLSMDLPANKGQNMDFGTASGSEDGVAARMIGVTGTYHAQPRGGSSSADEGVIVLSKTGIVTAPGRAGPDRRSPKLVVLPDGLVDRPNTRHPGGKRYEIAFAHLHRFPALRRHCHLALQRLPSTRMRLTR